MRRFYWYSNGSKRHAFRRGAEEALCGAVWSPRAAMFTPPCLTCLHALSHEQERRKRDRAREWAEEAA